MDTLNCECGKPPLLNMMMNGSYYIVYHLADLSKVFCSAECSLKEYERINNEDK